LHPVIRAEAINAIEVAESRFPANMAIRVVQGYRTFAEQDALFAKRPNPEAVICGTNNNIMNCSYKYAKIVIKLGEITRSIEINSVGQVSILES
jgi:hypothetical protein